MIGSVGELNGLTSVRARQAYLASLGFPDFLPQEGISVFGVI